MKKRRLLVIPARSGSKRIKNKNFKKFKGRPIISYSILTALQSNIFDKIVVSIDDKKNTKYLKKFKIEIFHRSKKLSNDNASIEEVLRSIVKKFEKSNNYFDEIWSLAPCSPLIKKEDLINASLLLKKNKKNIILPVSEFPSPIEWSFKISNQKKLVPFKKNFYKIRSQDLPKSYYDTGNFVAIPVHHFKKKNIEFDKHYIGLEIPKHRSIDIDDIEDWKLAEKLYR